ncbi:MAG TPA: DUF692 family protein [Pirellulales bacterium]|nr:DUF692 family protein [Pirellulales bacterium]
MLPFTGYAMREQNRAFADDPAWTGVEIDFQRANYALRVDPYLHEHSLEYVSVHALELSVASVEPPRWRYLAELAAVAEENGAVAISDHLGLNDARRGGPAVGHVIAPPCTRAALDAVCRNVDLIQRFIGDKQFFLENLSHFFLWPGEMDEVEFVCRVLERTGCGLLLDVTNAYADELNFGFDASAFVRATVGCASRLQMHLAGGFIDPKSGRYVDSHSEPIPEPVWNLCREALELGRGKFDALFIERDWNFPTEDGWRDELRQLRQVVLAMEPDTCLG